MDTVNPSITAPIFNIQSYSIHDGPGIRTTVFEKGCPLHCLWCANPESNSPAPQLMTYQNLCTGCSRCVPACPVGAIFMCEKGEKFLSQTDRAICTDCGACVQSCPSRAREISGKRMRIEEVLVRVEKDRMFLDASGGGMTVSGGECLFHPEFTAALLREAQARGIHTAVESCSYASEAVIDAVFPYVNLALLDIKHMDPALHRKYTGVPNEQILKNIIRVRHKHGVPVRVRVPVIPGCNDDEKNIRETARFVLTELGADTPVDLLPYHNMGESKRESLGRQPEFSAQIPEKSSMDAFVALVQEYGLACKTGG